MNKLVVINVINFFSDKSHLDVSLKDDLYMDLGLSGIDADFVLLDFEKEFGIDLTGVDISGYTLGEMGLEYFYYKWFKPEKLQRKKMTVGHFVEVVEKGYWFYPQK